MHRTISHLAAQGLTILLISSELPEILGMSDRVLVMREGRLVAELSRADATQERMIAAAAGVVDGRMNARRSRLCAAETRRAARSGCASSGSSSPSALAIVFFAIQRARTSLTVANWQDIATDVAIVVVVAVGETIVVLTRNIDLSVGSIVGLSAYLSLDDARPSPRARRSCVVALLAVGIGIVLGLVNGVARRRRADPGDHRDARDAVHLSRPRRSRSPHGRTSPPSSSPTRSSNLASEEACSASRSLAWFAVGVAFVGGGGPALDAVGRDFYAIGSNPEAARFAGIRAGRRVMTAFAISGALAGLGGFMFAVALPQRRRRRRPMASSWT